jgi:CTP:molybdopterin cytidylyltransferase MocA
MIEHAHWQNGQLSSLLKGLEAIDDPLLEAALVTLVDVPLVRPSTVAAVIEAWRRTRAPIVRPARGDQHGHPVIFDRAVFEDLLLADTAVGAKAVFAKHKDRIVNVEVDDPGAFMDMDTPEEFEKIQRA